MKRPRLGEDGLTKKIAKLPLWAQDICNAALKERDTAKAELAGYYAAQKPSAFYTYEYDVKQGKQKRFIDTRRMTVEFAGIELEIFTSGPHRDGKSIELRYGRPDGLGTGTDVALFPRMSGNIELRAAENMRQ